MNMAFLDVKTTDPAYNLALEQYVFEHMPRDRGYFMLWQNDNAIIIGRHQNTLAEINEPYVREKGIRVVRRLSGGGAVYHDLGNLNFTYIMDAGEDNRLDMKLFCEPIANALQSLGAPAEVNGRNDILLDGMKFSGNAQYVRGGRVMHHGTIMFDSDLSVVGNALRVSEEKMQAKGVKSVRSRVTTVKPYLPQDVTLERFKELLVQELFKNAPMQTLVLTQADLEAIETIKRERYDTWQWNYGASPAGTLLRKRRVEGCGTVEARIAADHGTITDITFSGDFFSAVEPETLAPRFVGKKLTREGFKQALSGVDADMYFSGLDNESLLEILCEG